jgi:hypothetical protein
LVETLTVLLSKLNDTGVGMDGSLNDTGVEMDESLTVGSETDAVEERSPSISAASFQRPQPPRR